MLEEEPLGPFNYNFISALHAFELAAHEAHDLQFLPEQLPKPNPIPPSEQANLDSVPLGPSNNITLQFTVMHALHLAFCSVILVTTHKPYTNRSMAILVTVNPMNINLVDFWRENLVPRASLKVSCFFRRIMEEEKLPYLIVTTENITLVQPGSLDKGVSKVNSESLREKANNFFKAKKYVEAILLYEQSLMHLHDPSHRNRSILFSNTAACLYQLKLYKSCTIYADLAILADPSYNKGYYRKINSLLELKKYSDVIPLLGKIYTLISKPDFESLNTKYTNFVSNDGGIFNWINIMQGKCTAQGEYMSEKVQKLRTEDEIRYYAKQSIQQYETILISKPLIYIKQPGSKFKESFINFLKQVENYYLYDESFEEAVHSLPCKCHPTLHEREAYYEHYRSQARPLPKKELFNKMQRCIFEEKSIDKCEDQNGYGIWKEMFSFENRCLPNCTGVHINGSWLVSALRPIQKGTPLSLDLIADVQPAKRRQTLKIKFQVECNCQICIYRQHREQNFSTIEQFYDQIQRLQSPKIKKQYIWSIINNEWPDRQVVFTGEFSNLIYYYIYYIEKECEWDDILNLLRLKEENDNEDINKNIDEAIKRLLAQYLKVEKDIEVLYATVIEKYIQQTQ